MFQQARLSEETLISCEYMKIYGIGSHDKLVYLYYNMIHILHSCNETGLERLEREAYHQRSYFMYLRMYKYHVTSLLEQVILVIPRPTFMSNHLPLASASDRKGRERKMK